MKRNCFFLLFLLFVLTGYASTGINPPSGDNGVTPKSIIIRFKKQFDAPAYSKKNLSGYSAIEKRAVLIKTLKSVNSQSQGKLLGALKASNQQHKLSNIKQYWLANIITCDATNEMIEQLKKREDIESISIDAKQKIIDYNNESGAQALTDNPSIAYNIEMARALQANDYGYTGKGIIVGILDTGVNTEHEDLKDALWTTPEYPRHGWNFTADNDATADDMGHGTHCAGTILGNGKSGTRTGIAPDARLMILKVLDKNGYSQQSYIWDAIQFAIENEADVLSLSLGFSKPSNADKKTWRDVMANLQSFNILAVVAAGNEGKSTSYYKIPDNVRAPGICPAAWIHPQQTAKGGTSSVVTVGALSQSGKERLLLSSIGPAAWGEIETYNDYPYNPGIGLIKPDIMNPGENILSLDWKDTKGYTKMSGTSMATPCVAGIVAAMLSKNPSLTSADVVQIISESAVKISPTFNNITGAGRADALLATLYTPNVGMNCTAVTIQETAGTMNGYLNPGDEGNLSFSFNNEQTEDIADYQIEITSLSPQAAIGTNKTETPIIKAGAVTEIKNACFIKVLSQARINDLIDVSVVIKKGDQVWTNLFRLPICKAKLSTEDLQTKELEGNGNSMVEAGEKAEFICSVTSIGTEPCRKVKAEITINSPYLALSETGNLSFDELSRTENIKFECHISNETPKWYSTDLTLKLIGENIDTTFTYKASIGKQAVLLVDRTKGQLSPKAVEAYLKEHNYSYTATKTLSHNQDSLNRFHSIWLFAGVYPKANNLDESESLTLTNYLQNGGYLYMEGGDLWYDNKCRMIANFNITPLNHNAGTLSSIAGCVVGFNDSYTEKYTFASRSIDHISPIDPAFTMYKNTNPEFITTVAYNQGIYRTIGSSFELGGILTNTQENPILDSYLDFFQIKDGYFSSAIDNTKKTNELHIDGFISGNEYVMEIFVPDYVSTVISLYGSDGQLIKQIRENIIDKTTIRIPINKRKGIHLVTIQADGDIFTQKVLF